MRIVTHLSHSQRVDLEQRFRSMRLVLLLIGRGANGTKGGDFHLRRRRRPSPLCNAFSLHLPQRDVTSHVLAVGGYWDVRI